MDYATYTNKNGIRYTLYEQTVKLANGKQDKVHYFVKEGCLQKAVAAGAKLSRVADLAPRYEVREIGKDHTPIVSKRWWAK